LDRIPAERFDGNVAGLAILPTLLSLGVDLSAFRTPIGYTKRGVPIYPIAGGDGTGSLEDKIDALTGEIRRLGDTRNSSNPNAKAADGGRYASALDGSKTVADQLREATEQLDAYRSAEAKAKAKADLDEQVREAVKAIMGDVRSPSMARFVGGVAGGDPGQGTSRRLDSAVLPGHAALKASFRDYQAGELLTAILDVKNLGDGIDVERAMRGKAALASLGLAYMEGMPSMSGGYSFVDGNGKATLGTTGATGGYVLPNNLVDTVVKPAVQRAVLQQLVTVINGVNVRGVDQPYRMGAPTRMTFQDWGQTKENVNETYGSYTANLGTIARVMDIAKQYARFSAGAAETDVMDELTKAAILAENYYLVAGAGTGSTGTGDPTTGVYTALNATPAFLGYKTAKTGAASSSTIAGAFAQACVEIMSLLAARSREASAILVDSTTFFTAIGQGSDTAGFWVSPTGGPTGFTRTASGGLAFWGVPVYYDVNLGTEATTKIALAAEWSAFKLYRGMEFRIDSSDVAGDRWDKNLIGFRGEEEIGFNADTAVHVGAAQLMTSVIP
jgi:HK97 family phage major capsid protein